MNAVSNQLRDAHDNGEKQQKKQREKQQVKQREKQNRIRATPATGASAAASKIACALAVCALALTACFGGGEGKSKEDASASVDPADRQAFAKYETPIAMRIPHQFSDIVLPEGDTSENNFVSRYLGEQTGISIKYAWETPSGAQYAATMNYAIRSGDLPDAFVVDRQQFRELTQAGELADLTQTYGEYASTLVKSIYDATGGKALQEASIDGRLYGLPNVAIEADAPSYLWVRQDWLDKLGLAAPKTLDDIARIAKAFRQLDPDGNGKADTVGIPVDRGMVYGEKTGNNGLNGVFAAFGAYPRKWIAGSDGRPVYGSVQREAKDALKLLAQWYKDGVLDSQFMLRQDSQDLVTENKAGIFFGPWWAPYYPLSKSISQDTKADWRVYAVPLDETGRFNVSDSPVTDRYLVVRKGYEHPEAALKLLNVFTRIERNQDPGAKGLLAVTEQLDTQLRNYYPFDLLLDYPDAVAQRHDRLAEALDGKLDPGQLDQETKRLYDDAQTEREYPRKNLDAWAGSTAYQLWGSVGRAESVKIDSFFADPPPSLATMWTNLQSLETETYAKIITGELPLSAFDDYAQRWHAEGGDKMAEAVREANRE
ncbi:extracellular solute-binding protein [Cohnella sp. GCM10020058]|uniref:extracellular solute-binding protein n=1 Tax=Cohnella sp. GCM10020058 TaxID=3317330 RepID=UPI003626E459